MPEVSMRVSLQGEGAHVFLLRLSPCLFDSSPLDVVAVDVAPLSSLYFPCITFFLQAGRVSV